MSRPVNIYVLTPLADVMTCELLLYLPFILGVKRGILIHLQLYYTQFLFANVDIVYGYLNS